MLILSTTPCRRHALHHACQEAKYLTNTLSSSPSNIELSTHSKLVYFVSPNIQWWTSNFSRNSPLEKFNLKVNYRDVFKYMLCINVCI